MHTQEENEILTQSGPGTPVGNLLRRYWTPALLSAEIPDADSVPVKVQLMSEDLVAFRDSKGQVGLIAENCPHRGASLYYGRNEEAGLRCIYHGWKFDVNGQCVDMPSEQRSFADQIRVTSYPTHESGGIVWTYMGPPETMTPFRDFGTEDLPVEYQNADKIFIDCNWVQSLDGDFDSVHTSYLHSYFAMANVEDDGTDTPGSYVSGPMTTRIWWHDKAPRLEVHDEWHGFRYASFRNTPNGNVNLRGYAYVMPYTSILSGKPFGTRQIMIVPRDDTHCTRFQFATQIPPRSVSSDRNSVPGDPLTRVQPAANGVIPRVNTRENEYNYDREFQRATGWTGLRDFRSQDIMVTETMGPLYDRTKEHWGTTDVALIRVHTLLLQAAKDLAEGKEPPAVGDQHDYRSVRAVEKNLLPGEDWLKLGTDEDPLVQEYLAGETSSS
jgi:phthalate 4,5-dioxygenase